MNKSKFLKRSLAALLAILMVATMIPSAFAAVTTVEDAPMAFAADDPGYNISVDGNRATWDAAENAYTAETKFPEGGSPADFGASMIPAANTTIAVSGKEGVDLGTLGTAVNPLDPDKADKSVDSFGAGTYTYTLTAEVTNDNGDVLSTNEYKLVITATMTVKSTDASLKAIKSAKLQGMVSAKFDNEKNTIELVKALGMSDNINSSATGNAPLTDKAGLTPVFIPANDNIANMTYNSGTKTLTVTAQNGDTKAYKVTFTEEPAFSTFKLGDFEGKADEDDSKIINVFLPYSYVNNGRPAVDVAKVNKLANSWTVPTGSVVKVNGVAAESGDALNFAVPSSSANVDTIDGVDYWVADSTTSGTKPITVKTKKSDDFKAVNVRVLVPKENPEAKLTAIQVGANNQIVNIPEGQTTVNVTMPYDKDHTTKDSLTAQTIKVWGSEAANVELARDYVASADATVDKPVNGFDPVAGIGEDISGGVATSTNGIAVSKTVYINVKSEDGKTTTMYTVNVNPGTSGNRRLTSVEFIDPADDNKVVATGSINNTNNTVNITVPFAVGIDPWTKLARLKVRAAANPSAVIKMGNNDITVTSGAATNAVYTVTLTDSDVPSDTKETVTDAQTAPSNPTADYQLTVGGITVTVTVPCTATAKESTPGTQDTDVDGKHIWTLAPKADFDVAALAALVATAVGNDASVSSDWGVAYDPVTGEDGSTTHIIKATASTAGKVGESGPASDNVIVEGWDEVSKGSEDGEDSVAITNTFVDYDLATSLQDVLDADTDASSNKVIRIPTAGVAGADAVGNQFKIKTEYNAAANSETVYTVTINKKAPSTAATISGVKVTDDADGTPDSASVSYNATASGTKQSGKIVVAPLPYALSHTGVSAADNMRFSELEVSEGAKVYAVKGTTVTEMKVTKTDGKVTTYSDQFAAWTADNDNWTKAGKEVKIYVFSEKDWDAIEITPSAGYDEDRETALTADLTAVASGAEADITPSTLYKMSASYIPAETGKELVSIASTLDERVKVAKASNTVTITVPYSFVDDGAKLFSLDIVTSKLATLHATSVGNQIVPDEGKQSKFDDDTATKFKVVKVGEDYKLQTSSDVDVTKLVIQSESKNNTGEWNIVVKVAPEENSAEITSISSNGYSAVLGEDGETWTLKIPADMDKVQLLNIVTASKVATVEVDGVSYEKDAYYDLGADLEIEVTAENGNTAFTYTLKIEEDTNQSSDATLSEVKVGEYEVTKSGNDYTVKVPEGTDVTKLPLTLTATDSKIKGITVNGTAYTEGMEVDLTTAATIVVTAEDGSTATYTLTAVTGDVQKPSDKYTDIPAGAMGDYIKAAIDNGIMVGTSETKFSPNVDIPRWQFALLIARADLRIKNADITSAAEADAELKKLYSGTPAFSDPKNNELYDAAIEYCSKNKIISGIGNNKFDPNGKVNRLQAARMISDWTGVTDATKTENTHDIKDWNKINWGKHYVNSVYDAGFMQGRTNGNFGPQDVLKRSEAAVVIMKAYEYMADK